MMKMMNNKERSRGPIRLSMSVDSIVNEETAADSEFIVHHNVHRLPSLSSFSSIGQTQSQTAQAQTIFSSIPSIHSTYSMLHGGQNQAIPDLLSDDGSLNNILDAFGNISNHSQDVLLNDNNYLLHHHQHHTHTHTHQQQSNYTQQQQQQQCYKYQNDDDDKVKERMLLHDETNNGGRGMSWSELLERPTLPPLPIQHQQQHYEHVYCQLDPHFNPNGMLLKSSCNNSPTLSSGGLSSNKHLYSSRGSSSLRLNINNNNSLSIFNNNNNMKESNIGNVNSANSHVLVGIQQALKETYRVLLDLILEPPPWYSQYLGPTSDLEQISPTLYQFQPNNSLNKQQQYSSSSSSSQQQQQPLMKPTILTFNNHQDSNHETTSSTSTSTTLPPCNSASSHSFWIEGEPGSGKTLHCLKLISDWLDATNPLKSQSKSTLRLAGFSAILYLPLREITLNGLSLAKYILHVLLGSIAKSSTLSNHTNINNAAASNGGGGGVWKTLTCMGPSLLIIFDGLDSDLDSTLLKDVQDVLNGLTFPNSYSVITTSCKSLLVDITKTSGAGAAVVPSTPSPTTTSTAIPNPPLAPPNTKYSVYGLNWTQILSLVKRYFNGRKTGIEYQLIQILESSPPPLISLASSPYTLLLLCIIFDNLLSAAAVTTTMSGNGVSSEISPDLNSISSSGQLLSTMLHTLIGINQKLRHNTSHINKITPKIQKILEDLGKLTLHKLSGGLSSSASAASSNNHKNRLSYSESELNSACTNNSSPSELIKLGLLLKTKQLISSLKCSKHLSPSKESKLPLYGSVHPNFNLYFISYYLITTITYPNILRRELGSLPNVEALLEDGSSSSSNKTSSNNNGSNIAFNVLNLTFDLLGKKSVIIFSQLTLLDFSLNNFLTFLRSAGHSENCINSLCVMLSKHSLNSVQINVDHELVLEWKYILGSGICPLEHLEIILRPNTSSSTNSCIVGLGLLIDGLCVNESISSLKLSSIAGAEWNGLEINIIVGQLLRLLTERRKRRLRSLELNFTCLEDVEHNRFQPFIDILCFILGGGDEDCQQQLDPFKLDKLVLDMDLTASQLNQLIEAIIAGGSGGNNGQGHGNGLHTLYLPHLGVGPEGFNAISRLIRSQSNLISLNLAGAWKSTNSADDEILFLNDSLPFNVIGSTISSNNSNHVATTKFLPSLLSSLPRGLRSHLGHGLGGPTCSSSSASNTNSSSCTQLRSPSIRRKKLMNGSNTNLLNNSSGNSNNNNNGSSSFIFARNLIPLPNCDLSSHVSDGFHALFSSLIPSPIQINNNSNNVLIGLKHLNLSKCIMNWEDVICLGETIRKTTSLDSLRMEGMKLCDVLPILIGLQENTSLQLLDLSSSHVVIGDDALGLVLGSAIKNTTLRLLAIQGWNLYVEEEKTLSLLQSFLSRTQLQDLDLTNVQIHISTLKYNKSTTGLKATDNSKTNGTLNKKSSSSSSPSPTKSSKSNTSTSLFSKSSSLISSTLNLTKTSSSSSSSSSSTTNTNPNSSSSSFLSSFTSGGGVSESICPNLSFLHLGGLHLHLNKKLHLSTYELIPSLLPSLSHPLSSLDLSLSSKSEPSNLIGNNSTNLINNSNSNTSSSIETKSLAKTLKLICQYYGKSLQSLSLAHWKLKCCHEKDWKELGKIFSGFSQLVELNLNGVSVINNNSNSSSSNTLKSNHNNNNGGRGGKSSRNNSNNSRNNCSRQDSLLLSAIISSLKSNSNNNSFTISWAGFSNGESNTSDAIYQATSKILLNEYNCSNSNSLRLILDGVPLSHLKLVVEASKEIKSLHGNVIEYVGQSTLIVKKGGGGGLVKDKEGNYTNNNSNFMNKFFKLF